MTTLRVNSSPSLWPRLLALLLAAVLAQAHQPFESTTVARLQHGRLEVTITMTGVMASLLAGASADPETGEVNAANFESFRPRLVEKAAGFYELQDGGAPLQAHRTTVVLNNLGELEFFIAYPQPATWPLRLRAQFLNQLPTGYGTVQVFAEDDTSLGSWLIGRGAKNADLIVSPTPPKDAPPAAAPSVPTTEAAPQASVAPPAAAVAPGPRTVNFLTSRSVRALQPLRSRSL